MTFDCTDFWFGLLVVTFGCKFWLELGIWIRDWNWGLGLGNGIGDWDGGGIGDWGLGIGKGIGIVDWL